MSLATDVSGVAGSRSVASLAAPLAPSSGRGADAEQASAVVWTEQNAGTVTTSTTTCATCCDYSVFADVELQDSLRVTELLVRFAGGPDDECLDEPVSCDSFGFAGPGYVANENDQVELCLSDVEGVVGPIAVAQCSATAGFFPQGAATVVRALDGELRPIDPPPSVAIRDSF
jgi:hypothetical protein